MTQAAHLATPEFHAGDLPAIVYTSGLSLVLPAYNESDAIAHSVRDAAAALDQIGIPYEVIVVDDGSRDDTAAVARNAAVDLPHVRVISLGKNVGYGGALRAGFEAARHGFLAFTDADGQFDLSELTRLLALVEKSDLVCGYRIDRKDPWRRKFYSRGYNLIVRNLLGTRVRDCDCALKIFRKEQILAMDLQSKGFFINSEILTKARLAGLSVIEVGVTHLPRLRGESKVSILHIPPVLQTLLRFWWTTVMFPAIEPVDGESAPDSWSKSWWQPVLLAVAACLLILPNLSYPLIDPDEARYAEIGREMLESGDFVVPTRFGLPYLDKPPLQYWLTAGSYRVFGVSKESARLVSAFGALATIALIYVVGAHLVGRRAAWLSGLALLSSCGFLLSARFVFIDTLLTFLTTAILLTGYLACRHAKLHWGWWVASGIACGLGMLAKGPVAAILCLPPILICRWFVDLPMLRVRHWLGYLAVVATVALPWFVLIEVRQPGFLSQFFWTHHFSRFSTGLSHAEPFWYYIPVLLIGMAPCSILFPATATFLIDRGSETRGWRSRGLGFVMFAGCWIVALYSAASCKLAPYMLPVLPLFSLVVGAALEAILSGRVNHAFLKFVRLNSPRHVTAMLLVVAAATAAVDLTVLNGIEAGRLLHWGGLTAVCLAVTIAGLWRRSRVAYGEWGTAFALVACAMAMGLLDFYPGIATSRSKVDPVVTTCRDQFDRSTPIICYGLTNEADSLAFELVRGQVRNYDAWQQADAAKAIANTSEVVVLANMHSLERLVPLLPADIVIDKLAQHDYIFVGVCSKRERLARRD
jgi:dolichol-phosphate mannosyltransferase